MTDPALAEFAPFVDVHRRFDELLLAHQERLVAGDVDGAQRAFAAFRADLEEHVRHENEVVLPFLEARGGWSRIGDPRFVRDDHDRILAALARFAAETGALDPSRPTFLRDVALLIGREQSLRALLEHHDDRERRGLYPDLVRVTTPAERAALLP